MDAMRAEFYGRERVLRDVTAGVLGPQPGSFTLVGTKYTGKTSLLNHLAGLDGPLLGDAYEHWRPRPFVDPGNIIVSMVDCAWQDVRNNLLDYLFDHLSRQLK